MKRIDSSPRRDRVAMLVAAPGLSSLPVSASEVPRTAAEAPPLGVALAALEPLGPFSLVLAGIGALLLLSVFALWGYRAAIGARLRAERAARIARARHRSLFQNPAVGVYVSTLSGRFLEVNETLAKTLGYGSADALIQAGPEAIYADPVARVAVMEEYLVRGSIDGLVLDWRRADGGSVTVRITGTMVALEGDEPAIEVIVQDISRETARETELRQNQKMEAIGRLAGGIAHDFNNLLTVIGGNAQLLEAGLSADDPLLEDVQQITVAADRATTLTRQLLSFSRKESGRTCPISLNDAIVALRSMLARLIGEDIRIEIELTEGLPTILADPGQIEQIVMNLALNARDAMPRGGRLLIETRGASPRNTSQDGGPGVLLVVRDEGVGMDEVTRARIFEPFFTTKREGAGTGLGLSTVDAIVRQRGGRIEVESAPGRGTAFTIWLPAAPAHVLAARGTEEEPSRARTFRGRGTILVVEDEPLVREVVERALTRAGYVVLTASDGREALDLCTAYGGPIDLVLSDVVMPNLKGDELQRVLPEIRPRTPVLLMTGYADTPAVAEALRQRPDQVLHKPFTVDELLARVEAFITPRSGSAEAAG